MMPFIKNCRNLVVLAVLLGAFFPCVGSLGQESTEARVNRVLLQYQERTSHFGIGLDIFLIGSITKNGFGFPVSMIALTPFLGIDVRNITNLPLIAQVRSVAESMLKANPNIDDVELLHKVKQRVHPGSFAYFQWGTEVLIIPKIGVGRLYPLSADNNLFFDFGFSFPWIIQLGFIAIF